MSTAEIKEMAASVKQNLLDEPDWDKVTAGVLMSVRAYHMSNQQT